MKLELVYVDRSDAVFDQLQALADDPRTDTSGGTRKGATVLDGCDLVGVNQLGTRVMTLAIARGAAEPLRELWIMGALGGNPRAPLTKPVLELIELEAQKTFDVIAVQTKRRGLIQQLMQRGYTADAVTLRKRLHDVH